MSISLLTPGLPPERVVRFSGLMGASVALVIAKLAQSEKKLTLCLTEDSLSAQRLRREIKQFSAPTLPVLLFPDWETLPYDQFSPHQDIVSDRLLALHQLLKQPQGILIIPMATAMHRLLPGDFLLQHSFVMRVGDKLNLEQLREQLTHAGYQCVSQVMQPGEFAVRGSVIDIYPMAQIQPVRIDLFDNEIDSLRHFDPETQRSDRQVEYIECLPAKEFPLDPPAIEHFRNAWRTRFSGDPSRSEIYQDISHQIIPAGIEYYMPLFFEKMATLLDYLPTDSLIFQIGNLSEAGDKFWKEVSYRYDQRCHDIQHPILPTDALFLNRDELFHGLKAFKQIKITETLGDNQSGVRFDTQALPDIAISHHAPTPLKKLQDFLEHIEARVLFCAESLGRREQLLELLSNFHMTPPLFDDFDAFLKAPNNIRFGIMIAPIDTGFYHPDSGLVVIAETQLYGEQILQRRRRKKTSDQDQVIRHVLELTPGTPVVHLDHGVGRFEGLQHLNLGGVETEFLCLCYEGHSKLYVPVSSLHLISRYQSQSDHIVFNRLGTDQWEKAKRRAREKVNDVAAELLTLYAKRQARQGIAYPLLESEYRAFCAHFPYETTPDQQRAIDEVIADLKTPRPMDRLVCGDVGFGKTEVALRAAFWVASHGKQVAVLVPTTLLAQQHFENFQNRFAYSPVRIAALSRFQTQKEQVQILEQMKNGQIDIVIGTHKLIQPGITFKDLGLVIIDEEHRFGVKHKEALKALRSEVDILTLTATPIPRTLNMALSEIRDFSIIATPPAKRLSIKTFVREYEGTLIREAILRELMRGGQVYYLYNEVDTIENCRERLEQLVPEARLAIAHGQMPERQLEQVMHAFYHQKYNILLCTTIIETGIDIPTANTIIMERADKLGLAQMHQLRGRVGRSHHQAYAFCLTPPTKALTKDAKKRLEAIAMYDDLGAGFQIATQDLEIRGAGELLGDSQSGQIESIGFSLYMEMLDSAVKAIKAGKLLAIDTPLYRGAEIDCQLPALIPDLYLPDIQARMILYHRIANAPDEGRLEDLKAEMVDRFGLLPIQVHHLFAITRLKIKAQPLHIRKIKANANGGTIEFDTSTTVDPLKIVKLIQLQPQHFQLQDQTRLRFMYDLADQKVRLQTIENILAKLN